MEQRRDGGVSRRVVTRTAWTTPALVVLPAARAAAASCASLPSLTYPGTWSNPTHSGFDLSRGGAGGFAGSRFGASWDPAIGTGEAAVTTSITLTLEPNRSYRLSFPVVNWVATNTLTARFVVNTGGGVVTQVTTDSANPGTVVHNFSTTASATVTLTIGVFVRRSLTSQSGDDIFVGVPTLTCV